MNAASRIAGRAYGGYSAFPWDTSVDLTVCNQFTCLGGTSFLFRFNDSGVFERTDETLPNTQLSQNYFHYATGPIWGDGTTTSNTELRFHNDMRYGQATAPRIFSGPASRTDVTWLTGTNGAVRGACRKAAGRPPEASARKRGAELMPAWHGNDASLPILPFS